MRSLTPEELEEIRVITDRPRAEREERLPDEDAAVQAILDGYGRLIELGWSVPVHNPKRGWHRGISLERQVCEDCSYDMHTWTFHFNHGDESLFPLLVKKTEETAL